MLLSLRTAFVLGLLALGPQDPPAGADSSALSPTIEHTPVACVAKDHFAEISATIEPADRVRARLYFTTRDVDFYFVDMQPVRGRFVGVLPRPKEGAGPVIYFIRAVAAGGSVKRSRLFVAEVKPTPGGCAADPGEVPDIVLYSTGTLKPPQGFTGVASVKAVPADNVSTAAEPTPAPIAAAPPTPTPTAVAPPTAPPNPTAVAPPTATPATAAPATATTPSAATAVPDYTLGKGDLIKVLVYGNDDLTQTIVIEEDGSFSFPMISRVKAEGLTPRQLEKRVADALAHGFVRNPQVSVTVQEYHSKSVFVVGEVARPGPYPLSGSMTVMEVLAKAGPTDGAGAEVVIVRPAGEVSGPVMPDQAQSAEVLRVNLRDIRMGRLDKNIPVRANDTVFVSVAAKVFVTGEVRNPGAFPFQTGLTARQVIVMAGGLTSDGSFGRLQVVRDSGGPKPKEGKIHVDDPVQAGDTIVVKAKLF